MLPFATGVESMITTNAVQRASVACFLGNPSREPACVNRTCGSAFYLHWSILFIHQRDSSQMHLLHLDGPCSAVLQSASDKLVNANRSPRLGFTASALYPPHPPPHRPRVPCLTYGNVKALLYSYSHPCFSYMDSNSITSQVRVSLVAITARHLIYLL